MITCSGVVLLLGVSMFWGVGGVWVFVWVGVVAAVGEGGGWLVGLCWVVGGWGWVVGLGGFSPGSLRHLQRGLAVT